MPWRGWSLKLIFFLFSTSWCGLNLSVQQWPYHLSDRFLIYFQHPRLKRPLCLDWNGLRSDLLPPWLSPLYFTLRPASGCPITLQLRLEINTEAFCCFCLLWLFYTLSNREQYIFSCGWFQVIVSFTLGTNIRIQAGARASMFYGLIKRSSCFLRRHSCHKRLFAHLFSWIKSHLRLLEHVFLSFPPVPCSPHGCNQALDGAVISVSYLTLNSGLFVVILAAYSWVLRYSLFICNHIFSLGETPTSLTHSERLLTHSTGGKGIFIGDPGFEFFFFRFLPVLR